MKKCKSCKEDYEQEEMPYDLCEDCQADFDSLDLEDRIEELLK